MHQLLVWWFFSIKGWRVEGSFPYHLKKSVIIVAPHTHSIDFFVGMALRKKMHLEFLRFLGKKELFVAPIGWLLKKLGGIPVDRSKNNNLVDQVVALFRQKEHFHIALSPEGTRKKVNKLKSGFYHIAKNAQVPIIMIGFDFANRRIIFSSPMLTSDNMIADKQKIIAFFAPLKGYIPELGITNTTEC